MIYFLVKQVKADVDTVVSQYLRRCSTSVCRRSGFESR